MSRRPLPAPVLRDLADRAADYGLSRRTFLSIIGAVGGGAALAACSVGGGNPLEGRGGGGRSGFLRWANSTDYIDIADGNPNDHPTLDKFKKDDGITVVYLEDLNDNDEFFARVRGQMANGKDIGYDIVTFGDRMAGHWLELGYGQELDPSKMPNVTSNLDTSFRDPHLSAGGKTYSVPWQSGFTGLAWNKEKVPKGLRSVSDMWAPELKGKVDIGNEFSNILGLIMWEQGVNPGGDWGDTQFEAALDVIREQIDHEQIRRGAGNDYTIDLDNGSAWASNAWSGDIFMRNQAARLAGKPEPYGFAIPDAGGMVWSDNMIVPTTSGQVESAEKLFNFYYDPVVAAAVTAYVQYVSPVKGTQAEVAKTDPDLAQSEWLFPTKKTMDNVAFARWFKADDYSRYTSEFLTVLGM